MKESISTSVTVDFRCDCGASLMVSDNEKVMGDGTKIIEIQPCQQCITEAEIRGEMREQGTSDLDRLTRIRNASYAATDVKKTEKLTYLLELIEGVVEKEIEALETP